MPTAPSSRPWVATRLVTLLAGLLRARAATATPILRMPDLPRSKALHRSQLLPVQLDAQGEVEHSTCRDNTAT